MKQSVKILIFIIVVIICFIAFVWIIESNSSRQEDKDQQTRLASIGNIQFKGKIINSKVYENGGRTYFMICIKLDYTNTENFYIYNNLCCLKIKNGIATMAAGFFDSDIGVPNYVEANMNRDGKIIYNYKKGDPYEGIFTLEPMGLPESYMNMCN
ncbi:hypothetical protein JN11_03953 [Mucilaginibacter frigoritolerans]|uniref:Uncharacterized protein n=1 Tax=Mucilaginibacter frigoritolerans TaxID=652788 RepID=A0A562TVI8_9SPHI|nr:hypothetical protein [Mucilaginibacter frigoritolerans]TWI96840.1 hypothetical protein JN11_03953 [Mucilaginibacter frigoritolerans]